MRRTSVQGVVLAVAMIVLPAAAHAEDPAASSAEAEALFRKGRELVQAHQYPEACLAFDASQKLAPALTTLFNQASCRELNHQYATAWGLFVDAERQTRTGVDEATMQLHQIAEQHIATLEPLLSKLTIDVPEASRLSGLEVRRDTAVIGMGAWGTPLPIDGGTYTIRATAPGREPWRTTVTVAAEHDAKVVGVPVLAPADSELEPAPGPTAPTPDAPAPEGTPSRTLPILFGAGAAAFLGTAVVAVLWSNSQYDAASVEIDDDRQTELWEASNHKLYVAEITAGLGVACVVAAIWTYRRSRADSKPALSLVPQLGSSSFVVGLGGAY